MWSRNGAYYAGIHNVVGKSIRHNGGIVGKFELMEIQSVPHTSAATRNVLFDSTLLGGSQEDVSFHHNSLFITQQFNSSENYVENSSILIKYKTHYNSIICLEEIGEEKRSIKGNI